MERVYELMMILKPDISDAEQQEVASKMSKKIESLEGKVLSSGVWAKERNLHITLKSKGLVKKKYDKGCYWLINFSLDTKALPDLKETIRLEERLLRTAMFNAEKKAKSIESIGTGGQNGEL